MGCLKPETLKNHKLSLGEISKNPPAKIVRIDHFLRTKNGLENYYPFGVVMPWRNGGENNRYGFNGKEKDDEVKGSGNRLYFGAAIKLINGSEVFLQYLKMFASTTGGDYIGQIEAVK